jgi:hypothetical protein
MNRRIAQFFALLILVTSVARAENWPQWRGTSIALVTKQRLKDKERGQAPFPTSELALRSAT